MPDKTPWLIWSHLPMLQCQSQSASWCQPASPPWLSPSRPLTRGTFTQCFSERRRRTWAMAVACSSMVTTLQCYIRLMSIYELWILALQPNWCYSNALSRHHIAYYQKQVAMKEGNKLCYRSSHTLTIHCRFLLLNVGLIGLYQGKHRLNWVTNYHCRPPPLFIIAQPTVPDNADWWDNLQINCFEVNSSLTETINELNPHSLLMLITIQKMKGLSVRPPPPTSLP